MLHNIFLVIILANLVSSEDYLDVNITQGPVRGYKTPEGIYAFYGIPYATAPTGSDKFKAPLQPPTWNITFEATERYIICHQFLLRREVNTTTTTREDCLTTNIYVPDVEEKDLPVVVCFHGGAYQYGYGESMSPKQLVKSKKVIALNFNYRLGAIGFLCLGTKDAPGNAGMKDQVALLQWVKKNIAFFGGNPNDVTLLGCSAGGSAIDLHLVSKASRGLFQKAIPQSGANLATFSVQTDPIKYAKMFAKLLNFDNVDDMKALGEFYKTAPISLLTSIDVMERLDSSLIFTPCIERDIGEEMFLDNDPTFILKSGAYQQLPMLYGFTNMEGLLRLPYFNRWKNLMNNNFSAFLPDNLEFKSEKERERIAQKIKYFYFGDKAVDESSILNYTNYFTDSNFLYAMLKSMNLQLEAGNGRIFFYEYSFFDKNENSLLYNLHGAGHCAQSIAVLDERNENSLPYNLQGAGHCAQSVAVFDKPNANNLSKEYQNMKTIMRDLWSNFIRTGTPVPNGTNYPDWPPVKKNKSPNMSLNSELKLKYTFSYEKRSKFWDKIYEKYYRKPIPPTF